MPGYSQGQAMIASQAGDPKKIEKADFAKLRKRKKKKQNNLQVVLRVVSLMGLSLLLIMLGMSHLRNF